jgi:hypothetical protein
VKFAQTIDFGSNRIAEFDHYLNAWMARTEGDRVPHHTVLTQDRDAKDQFTLMVVFASHEQAMENSNRPATAEFAAFLAGISEGAPTFRNLDVLREEEL